MDTTIKKMNDFFNSEEGQKSLSDFADEIEKEDKENVIKRKKEILEYKCSGKYATDLRKLKNVLKTEKVLLYESPSFVFGESYFIGIDENDFLLLIEILIKEGESIDCITNDQKTFNEGIFIIKTDNSMFVIYKYLY